jgi:hypothetical protein
MRTTPDGTSSTPPLVEVVFLQVDATTGNVTQLQLDTLHAIQGTEPAVQVLTTLIQCGITAEECVLERVIGEKADTVSNEHDPDIVLIIGVRGKTKEVA